MRALLRPLPLSIATMALLVVFKLTTVLQGIGPALANAGASARRTVMPSAIAAEHKSAAHPAPAPAPVAPAEPVLPAPVEAAAPVPPGPSAAELALLQDLRARRDALEQKDKALESRDTLLRAAERSLSERLEQLSSMQARLETLDKARRDQDDANWRGLVKTYETMRPRDAAAIFNDLDQAVLMPVLDRMKEAKAAPILAAMLPDRARAVTAQLAQWRTRAVGGPQG